MLNALRATVCVVAASAAALASAPALATTVQVADGIVVREARQGRRAADQGLVAAGTRTIRTHHLQPWPGRCEGRLRVPRQILGIARLCFHPPSAPRERSRASDSRQADKERQRN